MPRPASSIVVRAYRAGDDAVDTHAAFRQAVVRTASADYDADQIAAWAGAPEVDLARWDARRVAAHTFVAVVDGQVAGFADFLADGLLDMLFVHPDHGGNGVARALVTAVQREARAAGLTVLRTHASRTARPAFERFGFRTVRERPENVVGGRVVPNVEMQHDLAADAPRAWSWPSAEGRANEDAVVVGGGAAVRTQAEVAGSP